MKVRDVIKRLEGDGWYLARTKGDHRQFKHATNANRDVKECFATSGNKGRGPMKYAIVIEKGETSYGAYVPDLPGCVAVGETVEEVETLIRDAMQLHLEGLREEGLPIPEPSHIIEYMEA